jgi:hypothetical protein
MIIPWGSLIFGGIAVIIEALVLIGMVWLFWWKLPQRQIAKLVLKVRDPKGRADLEDNYRKTIGQLIAGIAVALVGGTFTYLQFVQQQSRSLQQEREAQASLLNNQLATGFERLSSDRITVRLGGIYTLEGVMNASDQYYQPVLGALCAFVRESTRGNTVSEESPATDVQSALTVIGRRKPGPGYVELMGADVPGANLIAANLSGANLYETNFSRANLARVNLSGANLVGAHLERAFLVAANLTQADLGRAHLEGADLVGAQLEDARLDGANLAGANLGETGGVTQTQIDHALGNAATRLPEGLTRPSQWGQ